MNAYRLLTWISLTVLVTTARAEQPGSVVFIHPDGTGLGHWNAARYLYEGPDGMLNWDRLDRLAAYRPHQKNYLSTSSHAGATTHAYGRKVHHDSYGLDRTTPIKALSGKPMTLMEEAMEAGLRTGIVNSGHIGEPGTGVFLARSKERGNVTHIAEQIIHSGTDLIFCGGEVYLLPAGKMGKHGLPGVRQDGRDLLEEARQKGYTVIYTREELLALPDEVGKVIGIFAAADTYNDYPEMILEFAGLPTYDPAAPTFDEMVAVALRILGSDSEKAFFLVAEEEGTDNFSNDTNARGMLDAMKRADDAIGKTLQYMEAHSRRDLLLLVGADSDAGHPGIWGMKEWPDPVRLPVTSDSGAELDGPEGRGGEPFVSQPDAFGNRHYFGVAWATESDFPGSAVSKAHGYRSDLLKSSVDNTGLYRIMYAVLFGE